jgi:hypothetical protein
MRLIDGKRILLGVLFAMFGAAGALDYAQTFWEPNGSFGNVPSGILTGNSVSIGGTLLLAGGCTTTTVTVTGAAIGNAVLVTPQNFPGLGSVWYGYVSTSNTVVVAVCALVALTPTSTTYAIRVLQ